MALFGQEKVDNVYKDYFAQVYNEMVKLNEFMKKNGVNVPVFKPTQLTRVKLASEADKIDPMAIFAIQSPFANMVEFANKHLYVPNPDQNIILMYMVDNTNFMCGGNSKSEVNSGYVEKLKKAISDFLPLAPKAKVNRTVASNKKLKPVSNDNEDREQNDNQRYRKRAYSNFTVKPTDQFIVPAEDIETIRALELYAENERDLCMLRVGGVEHVDNQNPTRNHGDRFIVKTQEIIDAYKKAPYIKLERALSIRKKALEAAATMASSLSVGTRMDAFRIYFDPKKRAVKSLTTRSLKEGGFALEQIGEEEMQKRVVSPQEAGGEGKKA